MPALPVIAGTFRVALKWSMTGGGNAVNVMHFQNGAGTSAGLYAALLTHVTSTMWAMVSTSASVGEVDITPLDGVTATLPNFTGGTAPWVGTDATDAIPQAAALAKITTLHRGRSYRGRVFIPFVGEGSQGNGSVVGPHQATADSAWKVFFNAMNTASWIPGVASYKLAHFTPYDNVAIENWTATQRRRQTRIRQP